MSIKSSKQGKVALERALSKLGIASRSQTREWILAGRIKVNKVVRHEPEFLVVPERDRLELDGQRIQSANFKTILLYKPRGVVTTRSDEKGRPTVFSLLKAEDQYLHAVGRLDMTTSGLLLLTNDTQLSNWLTDPANGVLRTYLVTVAGRVTEENVRQLKTGFKDKGELLRVEEVSLRKTSGRESHLTVILTEGKNREIRRMLKAIGHEVTRLKRVSFGGFSLGSLQPGDYRELSLSEIKKVFSQGVHTFFIDTPTRCR
jgi:pseudouridine synthase